MAERKRLFPEDNYTPNGYLDNPYHTYRLNQSGVIRSKPAMGFGWFYPHLARGYGRRLIYSSHLNVGIEIDGDVLVDFSDFRNSRVDLSSRYHSRNIVTFNFEYREVEVAVTFIQPTENSIGTVVRVANLSKSVRKIRLFAVNSYTRNKDTSDCWEEGLTGAYDEKLDALRIKAYSEGTIMLTRSDLSSSGHSFSTGGDVMRKYINQCADAGEAAPGYLTAYGGAGGTNTLVGVLCYEIVLPARKNREATFVLARSETENGAEDELDSAFGSFRNSLRNKVKEDNSFWAHAVRLSGSFPASWRHSFVYDNETLRMNIRKPIGIYKHVWDAMQIQAPRAVLAEACFDAILISYSDPETAKELLLGTFDDAPESWVPCTREDGSYNMVAWDGFPCGTAPEWGAPFWVVEAVYRRTKDKRWLRRIYPRMVSYINWWLNNRTDEEGYPHYLCSYESGQDMSGRFGHQLGGGYNVTHIRPTDLTAAMCNSFQALEFFAEELGKSSAARNWHRLAGDFEEKVQSMWCRDGWFHDYDRHAKRFTEGYDGMNLAPFFYGIAEERQCEAVRDRIDALCLGTRPTWATFTLMLVESAFNTGQRASLSSLAYKLVNYIYTSIDAPEQKPAMPLPGIQHEFWPTSRTWGAEGYGWGCFSVFLVLRSMIGFRESDREEDSFMLCPSMPVDFMSPGAEYAVANLKYRKLKFDLKYAVQNEKELTVHMNFISGAEDTSVKVLDHNTAQVHFDGKLTENRLKFNADNFSDYLVTLY